MKRRLMRRPFPSAVYNSSRLMCTIYKLPNQPATANNDELQHASVHLSQKISDFMFRTIGALLQLPIHPWLLASVPILHLYKANLGLVFDSEVFASIVLMLAATTVVMLLANAACRDRWKAALATSILVLVFSLSGHVHDLLLIGEPLTVWTSFILILCVTSIIEVGRSNSARGLAQITSSLNLIALSLVLYQLVSTAADIATLPISVQATSAGRVLAAESTPKISDAPTRPDIYYIIPDGYPSDAWLLETSNINNAPFTRALEDRGFAVVPRAQSNYGITSLSLASVLNMRFFKDNPTSLVDVDYLTMSVADSEVARRLKRFGYTTVMLLTGFMFPSPAADINRDFTPNGTIDITIDENYLKAEIANNAGIESRQEIGAKAFIKRSFFPLYFETTALQLIANQVLSFMPENRDRSYDPFAPERFLATIEEIKAIAAMPEATFTIVHLLKPHHPVTFNEQGEIIPPIKFPSDTEFAAELRFLNSQFLAMIDSIFTSSQNEPIIIFQADHGSVHAVGAGVRVGTFTLTSMLPCTFQSDFHSSYHHGTRP